MIELGEINAVVQHTEKKYDGGWLLECRNPAFGADSRGSGHLQEGICGGA